MGSTQSPSPPKPVLTISHCTPNDLPSLASLYIQAFTTSSPARRQMYSRIAPAALHSYQSAKFSKVLKQQALNPPLFPASPSTSSPSNKIQERRGETHFLKCTMTTNDSDHLCSENGKKGGDAEGIILALAIWIFLPNGYDDVADVQGINADIPKGADEKLWRDFAVKTGRMRGVDVKGRKGAHWLLDLLCTHPSHERKGAASKLARWAFDQADRDGMNCFVEASAAGHVMYERCGFVDTGVEMKVDLQDYLPSWEGGVQRWFGMVREAARDGVGDVGDGEVGVGVTSPGIVANGAIDSNVSAGMNDD